MQTKNVGNGNPDWIISRSSHVLGNYIQVFSASSPYDCSTASEGGAYVYRLHARLEK